MIGSLVKGSLLGGVVLFAWSAASWMALPWHMKSFSTFTDEPAVLAAIDKAAPATGLYILPNMHPWNPALTAAQRKEIETKAHAQYEKGPSATMMMVHKEGVDPMAMNGMMIRSLAIDAAAALALTFLVLWAGVGNYLGRAVFVLVGALAGGGSNLLMDWNWWGYPRDYTVSSLADFAIGWGLAALAIASVTGKRKK